MLPVCCGKFVAAMAAGLGKDTAQSPSLGLTWAVFFTF